MKIADKFINSDEEPRAQQRDIIVIGASAGGIEALKVLVAHLPPALPAAVFVVVHTSADSPGYLAEVLHRAGPLPAMQAKDRAPIQAGQIYVAPPDHHLLLEADWMRLTHGPKENRFRPAIDPLFRSAAYTFGARVIGVVLSGVLDDGTAGLWAIKDRGGTAIVQEPAEARYPAMPESALRYVAVDYRLPMQQMAAVLDELTRTPLAAQGERAMSDALAIETKIVLADNALQSGVLHLGQPSLYTCPDCHGVLIEIQEGKMIRFRCHTGHAFSQASLLAEVNEAVEKGLWNAVRIMEENVLLLRQVAQQQNLAQDEPMRQRFITKASEVEKHAQLVGRSLLSYIATNDEELHHQSEGSASVAPH